MAKILLDYVFPISVITPTPGASTAFLKQVCLVCKPKTGQEGNVGTVYTCTTLGQVAARTDNTNATRLFAAGMSKVFILLSDDLDLADAMEANAGEFYTVIISDDFDDDDMDLIVASPEVKGSRKIQDILYTAKGTGTAGNSVSVVYANSLNDGTATVGVSGSVITVQIQTAVTTAQTIATAVAAYPAANALVSVAVDAGDETDPQVTQSSLSLQGGTNEVTDTGSNLEVGAFDGVVGFSSADADVASDFATLENRCGFFTSDTNGADNMCFAFGKLLSNLANWNNQQYISMPLNDGVATLGDATSLFNERVSFVIADSEFGNRLALFACGHKAIAAPYIIKNLRIDLQSRALSWISANQPSYTKVNAALLEQRLQNDVVQTYIDPPRSWIEDGTISVTLLEDNFVATGAVNVSEPKALWRVVGELRQTL